MSRRTTAILLGLLLVASLGIRLAWLGSPGRELIVDERYYVTAARQILRLAPLPNDPYPYARPGLDPVLEHPIGGKLIIAGSIVVLGDTPFAWRLPSALFGTATLLMVFLLARRVSATPGAALAATALLALDPMMLIHSRVAMVEIYVLAFMLAGVYAYVADRPRLSGALFAAAAGCKLTGAFGLLVVFVFEAGRLWMRRAHGGRVWDGIRPLAWAGVTFAVVLPGLLWVLNSQASIFRNPFDNLFYMYTYLSATFGFRPAGPIPQSRPWEWLINQREIVYLSSGVFQLRGLFNPLLVFATIPVTLWAAAAVLRRRSESAVLVFALIVGCYGPFLFGGLQSARHTYLYYFLPTMPAVAMGLGVMGASARVPAVVRVGWLVAALGAFAYYFPLRGLP